MKKLLFILFLLWLMASCSRTTFKGYNLPARVEDIDVSRIKYFDSTTKKIVRIYWDHSANETVAVMSDSSKVIIEIRM